MSTRGVIGLVAVAVIGATAWLTIRQPSRVGTSTSSAAPSGVESTPSSQRAVTGDGGESSTLRDSDTQSAQASPSAEPAGSERHALPVAILSGLVLAQSGVPIADAVVSWSALPKVLDPTPTPDWAATERTTVWARSGPGGEFAFAAAPERAGDSDSVVWTTRPDFIAGPMLVSMDTTSWAKGLRVVLKSSPVVRARVVDGVGRAVREAVVRQRGVAPERAKLDRSLTLAERARIVLFRTTETGDDGAVRLVSFPGEQIVQAEQGALRSLQWRGEPNRDIVLTLCPTFIVEGRVHINSEEEVEGGLRLSISAHNGGQERTVLTQRVSQTEPFGPIAAPLLEHARYSFRLDGGGAIPVTEFRDALAADSRVFLELTTTFGNDMWFRLLDAQEQVIPSGTVAVQWDRGLVRERATGTQRDAFPGFIMVRGCPNGLVDAIGSAPGFADSRIGPITLPPEQPAGYDIVLKKAGRIEGRCLARGKPVPDFEIALWPTSYPMGTQKYVFAGRDDGTFSIDAAPIGAVTLVAASERDGRSDQVRVEVRLNEPTVSVIELAETMVGRGRVVDEAGNAITRAEVQLYFTNGSALLAPWGAPRAVKADGTFELRGFPAGEVYFVASAPGFSQRKVGVEVEAGKDLDLGRVVLLATQALEVRLRHSPSADATSFSVESTADDSGRLPRQAFSQDGRAVYPTVDAGQHFLQLHRPDDSDQVIEVNLYAGRPWVVEFDALGTSTLVVDLVAEAGAALPESARLMVQCNDADGRPNYRYVNVLGKEQIVVEGVPTGTIFLRLHDGSFTTYASTTLTIGDGERREIRLSLNGHKTRFRVLDHDGNRVSAVYVHLYEPSGGPFAQGETTDAQGECELLGVPAGRFLVGLVHDTLGSIWGLPIDLPEHASDQVIELEFAPNASVEVRLTDGDVPVEGVGCQLQDIVRRIGVTISTKSDASGRVRWTRLGPGPYRLISRHNDYWPIDTDVNARPEAGPVQVQIRRLGDVRFSVKNSAGVPVAGQAIHMRSVEFDEDVGEWARGERVRAEPASLVTDVNGGLVVRGLPHGLYRWQIESSDQPFAGILEVPRGGEVSVPIAIH